VELDSKVLPYSEPIEDINTSSAVRTGTTKQGKTHSLKPTQLRTRGMKVKDIGIMKMENQRKAAAQETKTML